MHCWFTLEEIFLLLSWCWRTWFFAWLPSLNCALDLPKKTKKLKGIIYNTCRYIQNHNTMNPFIRMELTFKVFFKMKWKIAENCPLQMSFQLRCCDIPHKSMYLVHILMNEGVNDNSGRRGGVSGVSVKSIIHLAVFPYVLLGRNNCLLWMISSAIGVK